MRGVKLARWIRTACSARGGSWEGFEERCPLTVVRWITAAEYTQRIDDGRRTKHGQRTEKTDNDAPLDTISRACRRSGPPARSASHCGLCLNACPTYLELGTEMDSPRGRIYLISELEEGSLALDREVVRHLDLCLGCRACEPACPSGVRYGSIIEEARALRRAHLARAVARAAAPRRDAGDLSLSARACACCSGWRGARPSAWPLVTRASSPAPRCCRSVRSARVRCGRCMPRGSRTRSSRSALRLRGRRVVSGEVNAAAVRVAVARRCRGRRAARAGLLRRAASAQRGPRRRAAAGATQPGGVPPRPRRRGRHRRRLRIGDEGVRRICSARSAGASGRAHSRAVRDITEFLAESTHRRRRARGHASTYHDACHLAHGQGVRSTLRGAAAGDTRPRAGRAQRGRCLLRQRRQLQPDRTGDGAAPARAQDRAHRGQWRGLVVGRQSRLRAADPRRAGGARPDVRVAHPDRAARSGVSWSIPSWRARHQRRWDPSGRAPASRLTRRYSRSSTSAPRRARCLSQRRSSRAPSAPVVAA